MHKETIKKILKKYKLKKDRIRLIETLELLDSNNQFDGKKGKDLIFELSKELKIKQED